jgi:hypothetical protein
LLDPALADGSGGFEWRALRDACPFMTGQFLYLAIKAWTISSNIVSDKFKWTKAKL